jgi:ribonucleotide monophosphatase NagD (HAD superfamily)
LKNIAFVDIDGVIANNEARFEQATINGKINWSVAFDPDLIKLDTLIDGADEYLQKLQKTFRIVLFSSRPEPLREATNAWLKEHGQYGIPHSHLVLKPPAAQYVKTVTWKALTLDTLAMFLDAEFVIYVDDEAANIDEVVKYMDTRRYHINTYSDLASAAKE